MKVPSEKQPLEDMLYQIGTVIEKLQGASALVFSTKALLNATSRRTDGSDKLRQGIATLLGEVEMNVNECRSRLGMASENLQRQGVESNEGREGAGT